ncbi:hypothetical protein [Actinomadura sp. CNU-125]|uniref:hypothetical protein n=1 Tax=Actinomadura sp. CNU-125 TaxID=1904961 RepID=UPI0009F90519|nr:hypothetical protein [Actinomadura sp. CNU-125]
MPGTNPAAASPRASSSGAPGRAVRTSASAARPGVQHQVERGRAGPVAVQVGGGDAEVEPEGFVDDPGRGLAVVGRGGRGEQEPAAGRRLRGDLPERLDRHRHGVLVVGGDAAGRAAGARRVPSRDVPVSA